MVTKKDKRNKKGGYQRNQYTRKRKMHGRGWTVGPGYISGAPGQIVHSQYSGPGKDCPTAGGGYSVDLSRGPLNPISGLGTSPSHFMRIPCEASYHKPMNGGDAPDMMKYEVPSAGYTSVPLIPPAMSNPGVQMQVPYNAGKFIKPCVKMGGGQQCSMLGMCGGRRKMKSRRRNTRHNKRRYH